ncbi:Protein CBG25231 [Caenorhabditis briggsae]|uniref:Protein CBG25231 n=1 Tax=Caenorhabditis briggsae TaxID=6238 RepID=B6IFK1_CAEBR|nr:Protein CBG25231 [Caenorhabditis briggsae]CAR98681.1 Protein CBG25231 [Caenorhabditis briggsae]
MKNRKEPCLCEKTEIGTFFGSLRIKERWKRRMKNKTTDTAVYVLAV